MSEDAEISGSQTVPVDPGPENLEEEESDDEVVQQPIPFQMGVTPMAEEGETIDELQTWYEGTEELEPQARGSTDPVPKKSQNLDQNPVLGRGLHAVYVIDRWLDQLRANQRLRFIGTYKLRVDHTVKVCYQNK